MRVSFLLIGKRWADNKAVKTGYRRRKSRYGRPAVMAPNRLEQQFDVPAPNQTWVTDITYTRTHGSRAWMETDLPFNALLMAVWRRQPKLVITIHSDQGSQFSSHEWRPGS